MVVGRFSKCVDEAISLVEFKIKNFKKDLNLENTSDKIKFLNEIAKIISKVENNIEQEVYIEKISKEYEISKEAIYSEIKKQTNSNVKTSKILERKAPRYNLAKKVDNNINKTVLKRENTIISILISNGKDTYNKIKDKLHPEDFKFEINRQIVQKIYEEFENGNDQIYDYTTLYEDEDIINHITGIMAEDYEIEKTDKGIEDILKAYKKEKLISRRNEIVTILQENEIPNEESNNLANELNTIIIELSKIK